MNNSSSEHAERPQEHRASFIVDDDLWTLFGLVSDNRSAELREYIKFRALQQSDADSVEEAVESFHNEVEAREAGLREEAIETIQQIPPSKRTPYNMAVQNWARKTDLSRRELIDKANERDPEVNVGDQPVYDSGTQFPVVGDGGLEGDD